MAKILVLYYSMYGHIEAMANKVAEGARQPDQRELDIAHHQGEYVAQITAKFKG